MLQELRACHLHHLDEKRKRFGLDVLLTWHNLTYTRI